MKSSQLKQILEDTVWTLLCIAMIAYAILNIYQIATGRENFSKFGFFAELVYYTLIMIWVVVAGLYGFLAYLAINCIREKTRNTRKR